MPSVAERPYMDDVDVFVAGGGLAGLVAARRLAARGANVRLSEQASEIGRAHV